MRKVVIVGAGVGGLTTAAVLAKSGFDVTVLEAHIYPGGCAGTFYHQGFKFDAGATLAAGFYPGGPMDLVAKTTGIESWPIEPTENVMTVHMPDGTHVDRISGDHRHIIREEFFGKSSSSFWKWQETTADALWDFALRLPDWPPQGITQAISTVKKGLSWIASDPLNKLDPGIFADLFRPAAAHIYHNNKSLKLFIDAQLLISAQATSEYTNALYAASALDLPRRGPVHLRGGMGAISATLVNAIRENGGKVLFRHKVTSMVFENDVPVAVQTKNGKLFSADLIIANLTPRNIVELLPFSSTRKLRKLSTMPDNVWGAFTLYLGVKNSIIPKEYFLHQQIIQRRPLGEGNSIFISISPQWDSSRAPDGMRAITISTHTNLDKWWHLYNSDKDAYEKLRNTFTENIIDTAERVFPGIRDASELVLPGTPVTFQRFTNRNRGWVGGFPQHSLFSARGPKIDRRLFMVGDSIFPGQSTAAVALGGLRVANNIQNLLNRDSKQRSGVEYAYSGE